MQAKEPWMSLGWRHDLWDLVRYYCSLRGERQKAEWLKVLASTGAMIVGDSPALAVAPDDVELIVKYLDERPKLFSTAFGQLRTEDEALAYCKSKSISVGTTPTQSADHHQSSKALVAAVSHIAQTVCTPLGVTFEPNPQSRCVWCSEHSLHVTARNLDGAIPALANPTVIWEIKEYWGKTSGGSKMSDAVYECNLVGRELREFEERTGVSVKHIVFVDGREQWNKRRSDLARFIDLANQGLVDHLFVGSQVESDWERTLRAILEPEQH
jgi:hypothetical protein